MSEPRFKRYIVFHFGYHDAAGGMSDIRDSFDDLDEAMKLANLFGSVTEIVDRDTWEIIHEA